MDLRRSTSEGRKGRKDGRGGQGREEGRSRDLLLSRGGGEGRGKGKKFLPGAEAMEITRDIYTVRRPSVQVVEVVTFSNHNFVNCKATLILAIKIYEIKYNISLNDIHT